MVNLARAPIPASVKKKLRKKYRYTPHILFAVLVNEVKKYSKRECTYVYDKGTLAGQQCTNTHKSETGFCFRHRALTQARVCEQILKKGPRAGDKCGRTDCEHIRVFTPVPGVTCDYTLKRGRRKGQKCGVQTEKKPHPPPVRCARHQGKPDTVIDSADEENWVDIDEPEPADVPSGAAGGTSVVSEVTNKTDLIKLKCTKIISKGVHKGKTCPRNVQLPLQSEYQWCNFHLRSLPKAKTIKDEKSSYSQPMAPESVSIVCDHEGLVSEIEQLFAAAADHCLSEPEFDALISQTLFPKIKQAVVTEQVSLALRKKMNLSNEKLTQSLRQLKKLGDERAMRIPQLYRARKFYLELKPYPLSHDTCIDATDDSDDELGDSTMEMAMHQHQHRPQSDFERLAVEQNIAQDFLDALLAGSRAVHVAKLLAAKQKILSAREADEDFKPPRTSEKWVAFENALEKTATQTSVTIRDIREWAEFYRENRYVMPRDPY